MFKTLSRKFSDSFQAKAIPGLDGIRAISCLFVIIGHFSYLYAPLMQAHFGDFLGSTIAFSIGNQYTGVTFFFVLSGFLITNILINEIEKSGTINYKNFLIKRVFRIFPAYYFYLICLLWWISRYQLVKVSNQDIWAAITYTYNYLSLLNPWHLGHFWSLSVEEQFYLFWPLLFLLFYKRLGLKLPWLIIFLSPVIRVISYYAFPEIRPRMSILTHTRFDSLIFGCLLAYYYRRDMFKIFNKFILKYKLHYISAFHIFFFSRLLQMSFQGRYTMTLGYSLDCLFMCVLIIFIVENKSRLTSVLNLPLLVHLGNLSYSLYLWHVPFAWIGLGSENILLRIVAIYLCALGSYLLVETPFMTMRTWYFKTRGDT